MDCTDCGACCVDQRIPLNNLEILTTPAEDMDGHGGLKRINGHCIRFDPVSRRCKDYENRPEICRAFKPGCGRCHLMRTWADAQIHEWFINGKPYTGLSKSRSYLPFLRRVIRVRDNGGKGNLVHLTVKDATPHEEEAVATTMATLPSNGW